MAKIVRYNGNLQAFASAAIGTERTLFGEVTQANDITSQFTADFLRGWGIVGPSDQPTLEDFNAAMYTNGQLSAYLHQIGIAEYNAAQEYHIGSLCNVAGVIYSSLIDTNAGNTPASSPSQWRELYAPASETYRGSVELATDAETIAGLSQVLATHPFGVAAAIAAALATAIKLPAGYFSGFGLLNNGGAPNTTIDVAAGSARDSTNTVDINLSSTFSGILQSAGVWTAGTGQNKLDTGARANNTWYHVFAIRKTSDGTGDILFSLSPTAPTMPTGYAGFVLIESVRTDGSGNILPFVNVGRSMTWKTARQDVTLSAVAAGNTTVTISTPPGRRVMAKQYAAAAANAATIYTHSPDVNNETLGTVSGGAWRAGLATNDGAVTDEPVAGYLECVTGTSSDIILQTFTAGGTMAIVQLATMGWEKL